MNDLRFAFRQLLKNPGCTAVAVLTLAFGLDMWCPAAVGETSQDWPKLEDGLERLRKKWNVPGMTAGVALHGRVVWTKGLGYAFDGVTPVDYPKHFVTAAGLVSTVGDVLRFSTALDSDQLLRPETKRLAFTPARSSRGKELPYGLGWFVQHRRGVKVLWHYGWDRANSTLVIKVPEHNITFVLLGNSEGLSRKFDLGRDEDVTRSPFAREFLKTIGL